jgi:lysophospholipase L1-like esterase
MITFELRRFCRRHKFIAGLLCVGITAFPAMSLIAQAQTNHQTAPTGMSASSPTPTPEQIAEWHKTQQELLQQKALEDMPHNDWPALFRYQSANAVLKTPVPGENRVVFYGDSITDAWIVTAPDFFAGKPWFDRGISGQTTPQMLVRFRQDVVALRPKVVVILAGTNDIAGNTGPSTLEMIEDNFQSMVEIARANRITPILASILPTIDYGWRKGLDPAPKIVALNAWLKDYAAKNDLVYLDYYSAVVDEHGGLRPSLAADNPGVHPNRAGYAVMGPLAEKAIAQALALAPQ